MRIPFFIAFIWFCFWIGVRLRSNKKNAARNEQSFWDRESEANAVRAQPLDDLDYITIPLETLPFGLLQDDPGITNPEEEVRALAEEPIVNLTGISNTDLKLRYGAANLTALSAYDARFTRLVTLLQKWGQALFDAAEETNTGAMPLYEGARDVLSYAVSVGSDVGATYRLLVTLYTEKLSLPKEEQQKEIAALLDKAQALNSLTKPQLVEHLSATLDTF